jgi:hypothetical protein
MCDFRLGTDCLELVFGYLNLEEKIANMRVCRRWKTLIESILQRERCLVISTFNHPFAFCSHLDSPPPSPRICSTSSAQSLSTSLPPSNRSVSLLNRNTAIPACSQLISAPENTSDCGICTSGYCRCKLTNQEPEKGLWSPSTVRRKRLRKEALLVLSITQKMTMAQFNALMLRLPRLASIAFHSRKNCELVSQHVLNSLLDKCLDVRSIDLSDCREVNSDCLAAIAVKCPTLRSLNLSGCRAYGNIGLKHVLKSCPLLIRLVLSHNRRLSGLCFAQFSGRQLRVVDLTGCSGFVNRGLHELAQITGQSLHTLFSAPIFQNGTLALLCAQFAHLRKLVLTLGIELDLTPIAQHMQQLQALSLLGVVHLSDQLLHNIMLSCKNIIEFELCLGVPKASHAALALLPKYWPNLVRLRLSNLRFDPERNRNLLRALASLAFLHNLIISSSDFSDEDVLCFLRDFQSYDRLHTLDLDYFQKVRGFQLSVDAVQQLLTKRSYIKLFDVKVNRLKLNRMSPYLYLTKLFIRRKLPSSQ